MPSNREFARAKAGRARSLRFRVTTRVSARRFREQIHARDREMFSLHGFPRKRSKDIRPGKLLERTLVRAGLAFHDDNRPFILRTLSLKERWFATAELINGAYKAPLLGAFETRNLRKSADQFFRCVALQFVVAAPFSLPRQSQIGFANPQSEIYNPQ